MPKDVAHSQHLDKQHGEIKSTQTLRNEQINSDQKTEKYLQWLKFTHKFRVGVHTAHKCTGLTNGVNLGVGLSVW